APEERGAPSRRALRGDRPQACGRLRARRVGAPRGGRQRAGERGRRFGVDEEHLRREGAGRMSFDMNALMKQAQEMQTQMKQLQEEAAKETAEASAGGGMVTVVASAGGELKELRIDPKAIDPDDPEMLADLVLAAANEALRAAQAKVAAKMKDVLPPDLRGLLPGLSPAPPSRLPKAHWRRAPPRRREPRRAADAPAGRRLAHGAAPRVPHTPAPEGGGARPGGRARGGQGASPLLPRVREPDGGRDVRDLPRRAGRPHADLRGGTAGGRRLAGAHRGVPRPLSRPRRGAVAARRRRSERPQDRRAAASRRVERGARGRAGDEPQHDGRGDGGVPGRPATWPRPSDAPREPAARRP